MVGSGAAVKKEPLSPCEKHYGWQGQNLHKRPLFNWPSFESTVNSVRTTKPDVYHVAA
jgi:hypothetical protein